MTTQADPQQAGSHEGAPRLTRSVSDRRVAGVAGGIAHHFGIDPTLVRIGFVVLTVIGGSGVALYLLGWLLLPEDGSRDSKAAALLNHRNGQPWDKSAVILGIIAAVLVLGAFDGQAHVGWAGPALLVLAVALLVTRHDGGSDEPAPRSGPPAGPPPPAPPTGPPVWQPTEPAAPVDTAESGSSDPTAPVDIDTEDPTDPTAPIDPTEPVDPLLADAATWTGTHWAVPAPPAVIAPRRWPMTTIALGAVIALAGIFVLLSVTGLAHLGLRAFAAGALVIVGAALVVSAWRGLAWGLIPVALGLGLLLGVASLPLDGFRGGVGDRTYHPVTTAAADRTYRLAAGDMTVDLSDLHPLQAPKPAHVSARVGVGHLVVRIPASERVEIHARSGGGNVTVLGESRSGTDAVLERTTGDGVTTVIIDATTGLGQVEVVPAAA